MSPVAYVGGRPGRAGRLAVVPILGLFCLVACSSKMLVAPAPLGTEEVVSPAAPDQRAFVLEVPEGETLVIADLEIEAGDDQIAIVVRGALQASRLRIRGGAVGLRIEGGSAVVEEVMIEGALQGVELRGGRLVATDLTLLDIEGSALFAASGRLEAETVLAEDVGYGLLGRPEADVQLSGLTVKRAVYAAVAIVGTSARLDGLSVEGASRHGAVVANDLREPLHLSNVSLTSVAPAGISLVRADATIEGLTIDKVASTSGGEEGTGVLAVSSSLRLEDMDIRGCEGEGVAAVAGSLVLEEGVIAGSGQAGVTAWRGATIELREVRVIDGGDVGVAATEGSLIVMRGGASVGNRLGSVIADCDAGSRVTLRAVSLAEGDLLPCVVETGDEADLEP